MVDYEKIGRRITELRKYPKKISQERFAEDLGMYQADVSNLEHAKKGSGITDLSKLDLIADYFNIPLEELIFGIQGDKMIKYYGKELEIKRIDPTKKLTKEHQLLLTMLMGEEPKIGSYFHMKSGPYDIYICHEIQIRLTEHFEDPNGCPFEEGPDRINRLHTFIFYENKVIASSVATVLAMLDIAIPFRLANLQQLVQPDVLDCTDPARHLNPYYFLFSFAQNEEESKQYIEPSCERMNLLRTEHFNDTVLMVESVYVLEDYRRHGMFRLYLDIMDNYLGDHTTWLNLEPTDGTEVDSEYSYYTKYVQAEVGQYSINAAIAEKMGFTIDPDIWHREISVEDEDGYIHNEVITVRKCAYKISNKLKPIIRNDGNLVELGRAWQKSKQMGADNNSNKPTVDIKQTSFNTDPPVAITEMKVHYPDGRIEYIYGEISELRERYAVSKASVLNTYDKDIRDYCHTNLICEFDDFDKFHDVAEYTDLAEELDCFLDLNELYQE